VADNGEYEIGYGKPPTHSRWKKGQSGNPKGRSNGIKSFSTLLRQVVQEKVTVAEDNGRRRKISKLEAALTQLANRAAQGELKATQVLLAFVEEIERSIDASTEPRSFTKEDEDVSA
jgi:Family of unknown function (DUF5681)